MISLRYVKIGDKYFDLLKPSNINEFNITLLPVIYPSIVSNDRGEQLLLDLTYKTIKSSAVLEYIKEYGLRRSKMKL